MNDGNAMYAVVEFDRDEDGPYNRTYLFDDKKEAIEFEMDCCGYARTYKLVSLKPEDYK